MQKFNLPVNSLMRSTDFLYGVATSSFQIEGDRKGRDACIWDTFCAVPGNISDGTNGDDACKHIENWSEDVSLISSLGVDAYRLSISWPRVMTETGEVNELGMQFYINLVDELISKNIKVFVTLYHWDLPQHLEDNGGWLNRDTAYAFEKYAGAVAKALGNKVHAYATLNEPFCSAYLGYEVGIHAPGLTGVSKGRKAAHHLLLAHGLAMTTLRKKCPESLHGIVLNFSTCHAATSSEEDKAAAKRADEYHNQWYLKPVLEGKYPNIIHTLKEEDRPDIAYGDMDIISQAVDYIGINFYTRTVYKAAKNNGFEVVEPTNVPLTAMGWEITPDAFTELLVDLHKQYTLPPIYITENGAAMDDSMVNGEVIDEDRIDYFQSHLHAVNNAIEHGVDIRGYFAWSLMDNFEWALGYSKRFGIVHVDYETQKRTLKHSAIAYAELVKNRINGTLAV